MNESLSAGAEVSAAAGRGGDERISYIDDYHLIAAEADDAEQTGTHALLWQP